MGGFPKDDCCSGSNNAAILQGILVHADENYLIINKPANLHIDGSYPETVSKTVVEHYGIKPHFINQLDYPTSGLMLLGLNRRSTAIACKEFQGRRVFKVYLAIVSGHLRSPRVSDSSGECAPILYTDPIGDDPADSKHFKMAVLANGKPSLTVAIPLGTPPHSEEDTTLVLLLPKTGRRHQLRLHLARHGHPIIGDLQYDPRHDSCLEESKNEPLLALHSWVTSIPALAHMGLLPERTFAAPLASHFVALLDAGLLSKLDCLRAALFSLLSADAGFDDVISRLVSTM